MNPAKIGERMDLARELGKIDIYLLDQILRGRIPPGSRVLDAGCGAGRNLVYLLRAGYPISGVDEDPDAIGAVRELARRLAPHPEKTDFRVESIEAMTFPDASADVVVSSAVLHFARDDAQFEAMLRSMWRVLSPGGLFFSRLASTIGIEPLVRRIDGRRFALPDGTQRYLVDEEMLMRFSRELGGTLLDPLKTTVVQNQRSMTTWVLRKNS
jgi:tellurite methyltransferase